MRALQGFCVCRFKKGAPYLGRRVVMVVFGR
jgi:hypothetical protein